VLSAGEVDGLPYYVKPFVKGGSWRARLAGGPLPIPEVVGVFTDVAKAISVAAGDADCPEGTLCKQPLGGVPRQRGTRTTWYSTAEPGMTSNRAFTA
jgi:hypothetical protein